MMRYINAYEVTLGYGGPEEGGWWYDIGLPLGSIPVTSQEEEADARQLLAQRLAPMFEGRRRKSSVAADAADLVICIEDEVAAPYPRERPHYE